MSNLFCVWGEWIQLKMASKLSVWIYVSCRNSMQEQWSIGEISIAIPTLQIKGNE